MRLLRQFLSLFIIFFTKRFWAHKNTHKQILTYKTKLSKQKTTKAAFFMRAKSFKGMEIVCLRFSAFMILQNPFLKKNNKQAEKLS